MDAMKCGKMVDYLNEHRKFYVRRTKYESQRRLRHILHDQVGAPTQRRDLGFHSYSKDLFEENIIKNIFSKTDDAGRKSMAEACKQWAKWFLLEGDKSFWKYATTLTREDDGVTVVKKEGNKIIQIYCKCREARTPEETAAIHRLERLREGGSVEEAEEDESEEVSAEESSVSPVISISSADEETAQPQTPEIISVSSDDDFSA